MAMAMIILTMVLMAKLHQGERLGHVEVNIEIFDLFFWKKSKMYDGNGDGDGDDSATE